MFSFLTGLVLLGIIGCASNVRSPLARYYKCDPNQCLALCAAQRVEPVVQKCPLYNRHFRRVK